MEPKESTPNLLFVSARSSAQRPAKIGISCYSFYLVASIMCTAAS